jgi:hypothetical protein
MSRKILDKILLDNYTNTTIDFWNPFDEYKDINFFKDKSNYYILAPINNENETYIWNFRIRSTNNSKIILSTSLYSIDNDPCIDIYIENKVGKINYVNNCNNHNGKDIIKWTIEIIKHLGCNKCILNDQAYKKCNKKNYKNYVSLSLIHKLKKGKTYYEEFDFIPYDKNNQNYKTNKIIELNKYVLQLQNIEWSAYNIHNQKWNYFFDSYSPYYPSPILAFKQFSSDDCAIFYDILFFLNQPEQPSYNLLFNINSTISKSVWMKLL